MKVGDQTVKILKDFYHTLYLEHSAQPLTMGHHITCPAMTEKGLKSGIYGIHNKAFYFRAITRSIIYGPLARIQRMPWQANVMGEM